MLDSHDVEWTSEKVTRFWNEISTRGAAPYFSATVTPALAKWISRSARPGRFLVDLGCGGGHLLAALAERGYQPFGVDSSPDSLSVAGQLIGADNVALGSVTQIPLETGRAQGILLIETIEHVLDEDLEPMMREIQRVLEVGRPLVITTPNNEDLGAAMLRCPECGARFHPMQHVRSWSAGSLTSFLREHGFSRVQTFETRLPVGRGPLAFAQRIYFQSRRDRRHLLAIART
jgi:SAM-dependent methyltransferase